MKAASTLLQILLLICCYSTSFATTYTTLRDGAWGDETNVWSTNGTTACACTPGGAFEGDDIVINHDITFSINLVLDGGTLLTINSGGILSATVQGQNKYDLTSKTATIHIYGILSVGKYASNSGSKITIGGGAVLATTEGMAKDSF